MKSFQLWIVSIKKKQKTLNRFNWKNFALKNLWSYSQTICEFDWTEVLHQPHTVSPKSSAHLPMMCAQLGSTEVLPSTFLHLLAVYQHKSVLLLYSWPVFKRYQSPTSKRQSSTYSQCCTSVLESIASHWYLADVTYDCGFEAYLSAFWHEMGIPLNSRFNTQE